MKRLRSIEEANKKWLERDSVKKPKLGLKEKIEMGATYRVPVSNRYRACRG